MPSISDVETFIHQVSTFVKLCSSQQIKHAAESCKEAVLCYVMLYCLALIGRRQSLTLLVECLLSSIGYNPVHFSLLRLMPS